MKKSRQQQLNTKTRKAKFSKSPLLPLLETPHSKASAPTQFAQLHPVFPYLKLKWNLIVHYSQVVSFHSPKALLSQYLPQKNLANAALCHQSLD